MTNKRLRTTVLDIDYNSILMFLAGDGLTPAPPDVFISTDGGYTWSQPPQLQGPHYYEIGDSGGVLFAISSTKSKIDTIM